MTNLLKETLQILANSNKKPEDVWWCGSRSGEYSVEWEEFVNIIKDVEYDNGYGSVEIAEDLVVVGSDWWLERHEYDGSEWWEYKEKPLSLFESKPLTGVINGGHLVGWEDEE